MNALTKILRKSVDFTIRNSPQILMILSITGVGATVLSAMHSTRVMDYRMNELHLQEIQSDCESTKLDEAKIIVGSFLPTILIAGTTIACIVGGSRIHARRNAVLAGLYSASELALDEYRSKVRETFGERKELKVREDIDRDHITRNPVQDNLLIVTGTGETNCFDSYSGRYFKSSADKIKSVRNAINSDVLSGLPMWASLNDFYFLLGIPAIPVGEEVGWTIDNQLDIRFSSHLMDDETPCLVIDYKVVPRHLNM